MDPTRLITIAGASSNTGKTTLLCHLLRELSSDEEWEAIKLTRGHHRSCGKDPQACCVSHLLGDQPTIRSGREETYTRGKDTGRFWDAGAANVHWVIATDDQVEQGIRLALARVTAPNVVIEGTSLLKFIKPDFAIMVVRPGQNQFKPSARRALSNSLIDAVYLSAEAGDPSALPPPIHDSIADLPVFNERKLPQLIEHIRRRSQPRSGFHD